MATLDDFRKQYPMYADIPDETLANRLFDKHYADKMSRDEFYSRINFVPSYQKGAGGILRDVGAGVEAIPGAAVGLVTEVAKETPGALKQVLTDPSRVGRNLLTGAAGLGQGIANAPSTVARYLAEKGIISKEAAEALPRDETDLKAALDSLLPKLTAEQEEVLKASGASMPSMLAEEQPGDVLLRGLGELPAWAAPGGPLLQAGKFGLLGAAANVNPVTLAGLAGAPKVLGEAGELLKKGIDSSKGTPGKLGQTVPPEILEVIETAERTGVPVSPSDLTKPGSMADTVARKAELFKTFDRGSQMEKAGDVARELLEKQMSEMITENFGGADGLEKIQKIADSGGKRSRAAQQILEDVLDAGEDWNKVLKTSGNVKLMQNKLTADRLYDNVERLAEGSGPVSFEPTRAVIDKHINDLSVLKKTNAAEILALEDLKADLSNDLSFRDARRARSGLNSKISYYMSGPNALVGRECVVALSAIEQSLNKVLIDFATTKNPELKVAWEKADKYYKDNVVPFKDRQLARALKSETNPDEIARMFTNTAGKEGGVGTGRAQKFYNALDDKGRAAVRYDMIKRATDKAFDAKGEFSPAKFATELEKLESSRAVFFKGEAGRELKGLTKMMRAIEKATSARPPMTGVQNYPLIAAFGALKAGIAPQAALGWVAAKALLNTKIGRNALVNLSYSKKPSLKSVANVDAAVSKVLQNPGKYGVVLGVTEKSEEKRAKKSKRSKK
jgi:hypothetical protein